MKKIILLLLFIPLVLWGCSHDMNRRELDEISLIQVLGIDYSSEGYTLSGLYKSGGGTDSEAGGDSSSEEVVQGTGKTPYEAYEDLKHKHKKNLSIAHVGYLLIGEEAAKNGLNLCLDFLSRDETVKMELLIYVTRNSDALDFIKNGIEDKKTIQEDLEAISQKQQEFLTRNDNTLVSILNDMKRSHSSILIPYLLSEESGFLIEGYTVFDRLKLKDYLDRETSWGINFIKDIARSFPIYLDNGVGLSLSYSKAKLKSHLENNQIKVTIILDFETLIKEVNTNADIFSKEGLIFLTEEQNKYITKLLEKPVNYSLATGLDILQLARLVENQHHKKWKDFEENWPEYLYDVQYEFDVHSKVSKSFIMGNER
ncbi:MAG TPA: Ger(x)C family spore germination protein [Clostridiales bacterium]|nr:Ger(x)C family spore germination protein [Clostridiales bacterium]